ncbi:RDD family protein [Kitasatospora azatica]|uniref:RDD family protein n=1 Tax=Kitasatospora azatica TaxID=58347 RepID=UPI000A02767E
MSDQPLVASVDTAGAPAPGYYPDPSVPGFVRYWNGGAWVPGTSRPAPAEGEVLAPPRFAARSVGVGVGAGGRYIPPPSVPSAPSAPAAAVVPSAPAAPVGSVAPEVAEAPLVETGPVFLDETSAGAVFTRGEGLAAGPWQADPRGLLETGAGPRMVSWGAELAPAVPVPVPAPVAAPVPAVPAVPEKSAPSTSASTPVPVPAPAAVPAPAPAPVPARAPAPVRAATRRKPAGAPALTRARLGRRALARLVDSLVFVAVSAAVAVPLGSATADYLQQKLDRARTVSHLTGREVQVWLVDGTVVGRAALLLGALLLAGLLLEVLPTTRGGRTIGKRLLGLRVVAAGTRRPPGLGRSLVRWLLGQLLVLTVLGLAALGSWPDRVARTKVVRI